MGRIVLGFTVGSFDGILVEIEDGRVVGLLLMGFSEGFLDGTLDEGDAVLGLKGAAVGN